MSEIKYFASAPKGVASVLSEELRTLGVEQLKELPSGVEFFGDLRMAYRACLWSRSASRILFPLANFRASTPEALYDAVQTIDWEEHLVSDGTLAVDLSTRRSAINHSAYAARKVKDAIVDQFRDRCGQRPSVDVEQPDVRINVHIFRDQATLSIDLSGESLHKRGYRRESVIAPLKENLAAALLLRAGWPNVAANGGCLVDPMCGSGTFAIEAAFMATDTAPGLGRDYFGFFGWQQHKPVIWHELIAEAQARHEAGKTKLTRIFAFDADPKSVRAAKVNVKTAGLSERISVEQRDVAVLSAPDDCSDGLVIVNPPYGERLGQQESLAGLYATLGTRLKENFVGWQAALFTGNTDLAKRMGIRAQRLHPFYNGALECKLLRFELDAKHFMTPSNGIPQPAKEEDLGPGAAMFANRLSKNLKELGRWAKREELSCYRLYDADMPEYALAIDLYEGEQRWLHVQEYEAPKTVDAKKALVRLKEALAVIPRVLDIPQEQLFFKIRKKQKGAAQYEKQAEEKRYYQVQENACVFWVNFSDYLDTGLFLDHRKTRALVGKLAQGKRFLNLFSYTGSATVYAALGGAKSTTSVDMSNTYLQWAERNLRLNKIKADAHEFVQADCLQWLDAQSKSPWKKSFGLIFLDPPTFSSSKRMHEAFDVQRDHAVLIRQAMTLLEQNGVLIFSNNNKKFVMDAELLDIFAVEEISKTTLSKDFARNPRIHNCWKIVWK